ncbi:MAG: VIT domain-containing protein [Erythrobacter sp.]
MPFRFALLAIGFFALVGPILLQALAAAPNPQVSALVDGVNNGSEGPQLVIERFDIEINQHGSIADVKFTVELLNPSDDEVEGRFTLQLPREAVLTGYALDIEGQMVPGSLIDQPKAKQIYEDEVRGQIDPGLAEISSGNVFSTRIYPIRKEGSRTISLSLTAPIDLAAGFSLPLETAGPIGALSLNAEFGGLRSAPQLSLGEGRRIALERKGRGWIAENITRGNEALTGNLTITAVELRSKAQTSTHNARETYFALDDAVTAKPLASEDVERIRIYWDRSRSRRDALLNEERALLGEVLTDLSPQSVDIVRFASDSPDFATFDDFAAVDAHLAGAKYRGATSFAGLDDRDMVEADLCILFSDGGSTIDRKAEFAPDCPLMIVASGDAIDGANLDQLARDSGGTTLFLTADNLAQTAQAMNQLPLSVISIRDADGRRVKFRNVATSPGRLKVVGQMPKWNELTVRLSGVAQRDRKRVYQVDRDASARHDGAGVLWASEQVARLSDDPDDRDAMRKMAQRYQVASPTMAFLVLETPRQYIAAELTPPDRFNEEWVEEYTEEKADFDEERADLRAKHFENVLEQWEEAKEWWERDFDLDAARTKLAALQDAGSSQGNLPPPPSSSPPPPPAMMAPAPPSPTEGAVEEVAEAGGVAADAGVVASSNAPEEEENVIIVTGSRRTSDLQETPVSLTALNGKDAQGREVAIKLEDVLSDQPYLKALDEAAPDARLTVLAEQELAYGKLPVFYMDVSEWFRLRGEAALSRELLLSALDLPTSNDETRQIAAFRLLRDGEYDAAIALYEALAATTEYRPQPKRALALALARRAETLSGSAKRDDLERAFAMLKSVALDQFTNSYKGIEATALMEANQLIPIIDAANGKWSLDKRLVALMDMDVRVVSEWTDAASYIDLWVTEPTSEGSGYTNQLTAIGGKMSAHEETGYGPGEYLLKRALEGDYIVRAHGYSGDRINPNGPSRVMVRLIRNFGRADQSEQLIDAEINFDRSNRNENDRAMATLTVQ